jgi:hypothetical protein
MNQRGLKEYLMKQGSLKFICLIVWACITVFYGFADETTINYETRILESFNGDEDAPYKWKTTASRFASSVDDVQYPRTSFVDAWPVAAFGGHSRRAPDTPVRSLGLTGRFDRKGYNWIDLYPVQASDSEETPYEIRIPGRIRSLDVWVWGANFKFYIEIYLRDFMGVIHPLRLGDIAYQGWRNLRVNIPTNIPQSRRTLPHYAGLTFVKFRIWTYPDERVDNFYIYFKQLKILTDMYEALFDGNDLADPDIVQELWSSN